MKTKEKILALVIFMISNSIVAWSISFLPGSKFDKIIIDDSGNIYVFGYCIGDFEETEYDFGRIKVKIEKESHWPELVVAKYDANGNVGWVQFPNVFANPQDVARQPSGSYVTVGSDGLLAGVPIWGLDYAKIATYSSMGEQLNEDSLDEDGITSYRRVVTDEHGNAIVTAYGNQQHKTLIKYDSNLKLQWTHRIQVKRRGFFCFPDSQYLGLATDKYNNIYANGWIYGKHTYYFSDIKVRGSSRETNAILIKLDSMGNPIWVRSPNGKKAQTIFCGLALDQKDSVYSVGSISGKTCNFGTVTVQVTSSYDNALIVKHDQAGKTLWAHVGSSNKTDSRYESVVVGPDGDCVVTGWVNGTSPFVSDGFEVRGASLGHNFLLVKHGTDGQVRWIKTNSQVESTVVINSAAVDNQGNIYIAGSICGKGPVYDFGGESVPMSEYHSAVLVKYTAQGELIWARSVIGSSK